MRTDFGLFIACALALVSAAAGCESNVQTCTRAGCTDRVTLDVRTGQAGLADGSYELELAAGGLAHTCGFVVPDDVPGPGGAHQIDCEPRLAMSLQPAIACTEQRSGATVTESCAQVGGELMLSAFVEGSPQTIALRIERDSVVVMDETLTPAYETVRPNGPDCEPECRLATVELTLP